MTAVVAEKPIVAFLLRHCQEVVAFYAIRAADGAGFGWPGCPLMQSEPSGRE